MKGNVYEVDKIISKRYNRRLKQNEFLVHWKGYDSDDDTWEPEKNLDCGELLREFERSQEQASPSSALEASFTVSGQQKRTVSSRTTVTSSSTTRGALSEQSQSTVFRSRGSDVKSSLTSAHSQQEQALAAASKQSNSPPSGEGRRRGSGTLKLRRSDLLFLALITIVLFLLVAYLVPALW